MFVLLQASVAQLEQQLADCESDLVEEKIVSQERKHEAVQCQYQVDICSFILLITFFSFIFVALTWKIRVPPPDILIWKIKIIVVVVN